MWRLPWPSKKATSKSVLVAYQGILSRAPWSKHLIVREQGCFCAHAANRPDASAWQQHCKAILLTSGVPGPARARTHRMSVVDAVSLFAEQRALSARHLPRRPFGAGRAEGACKGRNGRPTGTDLWTGTFVHFLPSWPRRARSGTNICPALADCQVPVRALAAQHNLYTGLDGPSH